MFKLIDRNNPIQTLHNVVNGILIVLAVAVAASLYSVQPEVATINQMGFGVIIAMGVASSIAFLMMLLSVVEVVSVDWTLVSIKAAGFLVALYIALRLSMGLFS